MMDNRDSEYGRKLSEAREAWNAEAPGFDEPADHGLRDPVVRAAWTELIRNALPHSKGTVLDIGCGTGSLSLVLAGLGYAVTGIDLSPEMIALAEAKTRATNYSIKFQVMDAAFPLLAAGLFDAIVCRHLLWALPEIDQVLQRWVRLLKPGGRLVLIEGYWFTNAGLHAPEIMAALPSEIINRSVQNLSEQVALWGKQVTDERYMITAELRG